jgi:hypothetical protein
MKINSQINCKREDETVDITSQSGRGPSGTVPNSKTCSCRHYDCPNNRTACIDNPDEPGIIQLPCLREKPSLDLCSSCCMLGYLEGICAFYKERM